MGSLDSGKRRIVNRFNLVEDRLYGSIGMGRR